MVAGRGDPHIGPRAERGGHAGMNRGPGLIRWDETGRVGLVYGFVVDRVNVSVLA